MTPIRRATAGDIEALVELRVALLEEAGHAGTLPEQLRDMLRAYFVKHLATGSFFAFVAEDDGRIVASSGMVFIDHPPSGDNFDGRRAYIMNMYTLPQWRGRGIAGRIVDALVKHAHGLGIRVVGLHALDKARPVYERAGFVAGDSEMVLELK